jgi:hypothetical protein
MGVQSEESTAKSEHRNGDSRKTISRLDVLLHYTVTREIEWQRMN